MELRQRLKNFFALSLALSFSAIALVLGGCTGGTSNVGAVSDEASSAASRAASEAEAEEEQMSLRKAKTGRTAAPPRKPASKESIFVVQVGTFKIESNARSLVESLKSTGLPVIQKKIQRANGDVLYTVRIEPTPSREEAEKFVATVKSAVGVNALILSVGR